MNLDGQPWVLHFLLPVLPLAPPGHVEPPSSPFVFTINFLVEVPVPHLLLHLDHPVQLPMLPLHTLNPSLLISYTHALPPFSAFLSVIQSRFWLPSGCLSSSLQPAEHLDHGPHLPTQSTGIMACNGGLTTGDVGGTFRSSLDSGDIELTCTGVDLFIVKYTPVTRELTSNNITSISNMY